MNTYNIFPFLENIYNMEIISPKLFDEIMHEYELSASNFEDMKDNVEEQLRVSELMNKKIFHKEKKEYHTITSKDDFSQLVKKNSNNKSSSITLMYTPLNTHSRDKLSIGDILFSYRNGQFGDLNEALNTRGIYGLGIAITNPIKFNHQYEAGSREEYKDYGVIVAYPYLLENHLSVRSIQLHPETIDLTPYNGNRNDSLQHIESPKHYNTLLGMILYQNPSMADYLNRLNLNVDPISIPDDIWNHLSVSEDKAKINNTNYKTAFINWLPNVVSSKSTSNYVSGLNTLEKIWNNKNPNNRINIWTEPYSLNYDYIVGNEEIIKLNDQQNGTQFAALKKYFEFLEMLKNENNEVPDNETALITSGLNKIYFGAPGTGKSYGIRGFIQENGITNYDEKIDHPNVFRTTLHPEFTYNDFVGQVMPVVLNSDDDNEPSKIEYKFSPQIFTNALKRAFEVEETEPVFLILEEMSRANVAAVFGDLFQLLDRDVNGESEYKINNELIAQEIWEKYTNKKIYTNDQNVFVMDTAFKRRFEFDYVDANNIVKDDSGDYLNDFKFKLKEADNILSFSWIDLFSNLNSFITTKIEKGGLGLPEDKQVGQFFIKFKEDNESYNYNQLKGKLLQYLWHDIENISYADNKLFKSSINNFSDAFTELSKGNNIFSKELLAIMNYDIIDISLETQNSEE